MLQSANTLQRKQWKLQAALEKYNHFIIFKTNIIISTMQWIQLCCVQDAQSWCKPGVQGSSSVSSWFSLTTHEHANYDEVKLRHELLFCNLPWPMIMHQVSNFNSRKLNQKPNKIMVLLALSSNWMLTSWVNSQAYRSFG